jgi:uncharacterized protein (TIGR00266 family)
MQRRSDEVDYKLIGDDLQAVVVTLDPNEQVIAEAGAMLYMTNGIDMQTSMSGDRSQGFFGNLVKAVGRMVAGESFFITTFTNVGPYRADVAFAAPYPGKIIPVDLMQIGGEIHCQKDAFLCAARGTDVTVAFQRKLGAGFFGGEGFILQRVQGDGLAFLHAGGAVMSMTLQPGEILRVDTGCVVAFQPTVRFDIQFVGGFKNALFGGEGLFLATLTGPGFVMLQTLPFNRLADRIASAASVSKGGGSMNLFGDNG